ncbi:MAG: DUF190 domain-containing protein [Cyanobacteria bacterium J06592_8]
MTTWKKLKIYVSEEDRFEHHSLYKAIIEVAHKKGMAGATVFQAIEGYAGKSPVQTVSILALSENLPLAIEIIDEEEKVREFYAEIKGMLQGHLTVLEPVELLQWGES